MNCPRCAQDVLINSVCCFHCGYHLGAADELFGYEDVHFHKLSDLAGCLREEERDSVQELIADLERRFPQLWFGVCFAALAERANLREFGFWLLNHAAVADGDPLRPNENGVLLCIDLTSRGAGFTLGYLVERFVSDGDLFRSLDQGMRHFVDGDFQAGTTAALKQFAEILARRARHAARHPEKFARRQPMEPSEEVDLRPIRVGQPKDEAREVLLKRG